MDRRYLSILCTGLVLAWHLSSGCSYLPKFPKQSTPAPTPKPHPSGAKATPTAPPTKRKAPPARTATAPSKPRALPKKIQAEEFQVLDKTGKVRAVLRVDDRTGPGRHLYDGKGRLRAVFRVLEDGTAHLFFLDEKGNTPTHRHSLP